MRCSGENLNEYSHMMVDKKPQSHRRKEYFTHGAIVERKAPAAFQARNNIDFGLKNTFMPFW